MALIVDLDDTLCHAAWREPIIQDVGWDAYYEAAKDDKPVETIIHLVNLFFPDTVIVTTERPEKHRIMTMQWLLRHKVRVSILLMRADDDWRPAHEVKLALVDGQTHKPLLVIDDSDAVIEAWRARGVPTLQVTA